MAQAQPSAHSWDWKPSSFSNMMVAVLLHTPILHRLISNQILLLSFKGRKSGKRITIPVGYTRDGNTLTILTKCFRGWWHNFEAAVPVDLLIAGNHCHGTARATANAEMSTNVLSDVLQKYPYQAEFYGLHLNEFKQADRDDIRDVASTLIVVQIRLEDL
jgi:hypothetical protein